MGIFGKINVIIFQNEYNVIILVLFYKHINSVCFLCFPVKDYQLIQCQDFNAVGFPEQTEVFQKTLFGRYLSNFTSIISHLLQASQDNGSHDAVEASWVLSLALKGLYNTLKVMASIWNYALAPFQF